MKHLIWTVIAVCILQACTEHKGYVITGNAPNADGKQMMLKKIIDAGSDPVAMDSCIVKDGKFEMKGTAEYPEYCLLYAGDNGPLYFFIENSAITIDVNPDNIHQSTVTGSKEHDLYLRFVDGITDFETRYKKVNDEYMALKLSDTTDTEKESGYMAQMNQIREESDSFAIGFVRENPNRVSAAAIVATSLSRRMTADEMEAFVNGFDDTTGKSSWVQIIREKAEITRRLAAGQPFSDITLNAPDGRTVSLSDYAGKGKYIMIDFWASWCRPCRMANPQVVKMYDRYKDKGFEIVGISLDRDKNEWTQAIADDGLTWPQMSDLKFWQSAAAKLYNVNSIPHTVLLDKDGKILACGLPSAELEAKLAELLK